MTVSLPLGFRAHVTNIGIKDTSDDFTVVVADTACSAAGMFTQSRFAGPSVVISREHVTNLQAQAVVVVSKNANVATGNEGIANAHEIVNGVAAALTCSPSDILIASTGVIGRQYPMDNVRAGLASREARLSAAVRSCAHPTRLTSALPRRPSCCPCLRGGRGARQWNRRRIKRPHNRIPARWVGSANLVSGCTQPGEAATTQAFELLLGGSPSLWA